MCPQAGAVSSKRHPNYILVPKMEVQLCTRVKIGPGDPNI